MTETTDVKIVRLQTEMKSMISDVAEVKSLVKEVIVKVDNIVIVQGEINQLKVEITTLKTEISTLKGVNSLKNTMLWVGLVASAVVNVLVIYQLFTGRHS
jgi:peptidoglycan hydrolase CwlO-like protein